ncbi:MAG: hypothetical protein DMF59_07490 [Acidobacteria bacterium]|nr:MAG: hypothetical protein DMF59_07490 [Acidobacteriota bacterium]
MERLRLDLRSLDFRLRGRHARARRRRGRWRRGRRGNHERANRLGDLLRMFLDVLRGENEQSDDEDVD